MGINREQVIKALECCIEGIDCTLCPYFDKDSCPQILNENALALIKELTEENERLTESALKIAEQHQAYIIRKMQKRIKSVSYQSKDWSHGEHPMVVEVDDIDQIVKEMLEEIDEE